MTTPHWGGGLTSVSGELRPRRTPRMYDGISPMICWENIPGLNSQNRIIPLNSSRFSEATGASGIKLSMGSGWWDHSVGVKINPNPQTWTRPIFTYESLKRVERLK